MKLQGHGWHWPFGWLVVLIDPDRSKSFRNARSYEDAKRIRDEELDEGDFEEAWIRMKTT